MDGKQRSDESIRLDQLTLIDSTIVSLNFDQNGEKQPS